MANVCAQNKLIKILEFHFPFYCLEILVLGNGWNGLFSEITTACKTLISPCLNQLART